MLNFHIYNYKKKFLKKIYDHWKNGKIQKLKSFLKHYRQVHHIFNLIEIMANVQFHIMFHCLTLYYKFFLRPLKIPPKL